MMKFAGIWILFFLGTAMLFCQESSTSKDLLKRAKENFQLLNTNPEEAFKKAGEIAEEAKRLNVQEAELYSMTTQCVYFKTINDFKNMMIYAESLFQTAEEYNKYVYQAIAKKYLFKAYFFSGLPEKALLQLNEGIKIINKEDVKDSFAMMVKGDLFILYSNYYSFKNDHENHLKYLKLSIQEYEELDDEKEKQRLQYIYNSNLSEYYYSLNSLDSAEYYANLSLSKDKSYNRDDVQSLNFLVLGRVAMKRENYKNAIYYFQNAEQSQGHKIQVNTEILYESIIQSYRALNESENVKLYEAKRDSLRLSISQNQNKSLHKLLNETGNKSYKYILVTFFVLAVVMIFFTIRKNKILAYQEKISQHYLEKIAKNQNAQAYSKLIEMIQKNDAAFMAYFDEVFPGFTPKLLEINPKVLPSEIEFCALLKLKIPTHDIAKYKYITLKSVQNKKYLIRKKLNIPKGIDIYNWFSLL